MASLLSSSSSKQEIKELTLDNLEAALENDNKIKLAGIDIDGTIRCRSILCLTDML